MCLCILLAQFGSTEGEKNEEAQSNLVSGISDKYEIWDHHKAKCDGRDRSQNPIGASYTSQIIIERRLGA